MKELSIMLQRPTLYRPARSRRQRASARRRFRHGWRAAAVRAATAAKLYLDKQVRTLTVAAEACGSNVEYVRAAVVLIKTENQSLLGLAMAGHVSLLEAAKQVRQQWQCKAESITVDEAVAGWRAWTPDQRAEFGRGAGIAELWDGSIVPVISEERASAQAAE
jgi:hypothetical protein